MLPTRASVLLTCLLAVAALVAAATSGATEPKAPATPAQIVAYHDSGEWNADTTKQVGKAKKFVKQWLKAHKRPRPRKPAIVLDIDDTSLSLYACAKAKNFEEATLCAVETDLPAISQVRSLYRWARAPEGRGVLHHRPAGGAAGHNGHGAGERRVHRAS